MLGERIRQRRVEKGLTAASLARAADVSRNYISKLENGFAANPSAPILQRLADSLGTSVADLLGQESIQENEMIPLELQELAEQEGLTATDVAALAAVRWRGQQPRTLGDWRFLYEAIRRSMPDQH